MKDFSDFLEYTQEEDFINELGQISSSEVIECECTPENISKVVELMYQKAVTVAVSASLAYLRRYHEWLSEQSVK